LQGDSIHSVLLQSLLQLEDKHGSNHQTSQAHFYCFTYNDLICVISHNEAFITSGWVLLNADLLHETAETHIDSVAVTTSTNSTVCVPVQPSVVLYYTALPSKRHPAVLVCSVYDFYPKQIKMSWFRDGQEVTSEVTSTDVMQDGDWYYQIHSHLEYTPRSGEKISCVVEHASLEEPLKTYWDPSMPKSDEEKIAIGASALILDLIFGLAGFIYYKNPVPGPGLVPGPGPDSVC
uniref:Ig-like domain-containing protein n=1 Tax=Amphiprion percula TaxID=161767 RepID=A0A3P8TI05_AMPPE